MSQSVTKTKTTTAGTIAWTGYWEWRRRGTRTRRRFSSTTCTSCTKSSESKSTFAVCFVSFWCCGLLVGLSVCLSACLFVSFWCCGLSVCLSDCLFVCFVLVLWFVGLSVCLSV